MFYITLRYSDLLLTAEYQKKKSAALHHE